MTTLLLHLITLEDVIADCEIVGDRYELSNPIAIGVSREGVSIIPWIPYSESRKFSVEKSAVITTGVPHSDLLAKYAEITGKIVVPKSNIILN
jgi:hypothetical protein